ncbi:MAG: hypothetical protein ACTSQJ_11790 [Promethearchaeota archaeon]
MKKPIGIYIVGAIYLFLGIVVIIGYLYLIFTDWAAFSFDSYNAGDVEYSGEAAEFVTKYALGPVLFIGGIFAVLGSILILKKEESLGWYLTIIASVMWTLPIIGLITIWYFLKDDIKDIYLK